MCEAHGNLGARCAADLTKWLPYTELYNSVYGVHAGIYIQENSSMHFLSIAWDQVVPTRKQHGLRNADRHLQRIRGAGQVIEFVQNVVVRNLLEKSIAIAMRKLEDGNCFFVRWHGDNDF